MYFKMFRDCNHQDLERKINTWLSQFSNISSVNTSLALQTDMQRFDADDHEEYFRPVTEYIVAVTVLVQDN